MNIATSVTRVRILFLLLFAFCVAGYFAVVRLGQTGSWQQAVGVLLVFYVMWILGFLAGKASKHEKP